MKASELLKRLVYFVESAGVVKKFSDMSKFDFINGTFGPSTFTGNIKESAIYLYIYEDSLKGIVPDAVVSTIDYHDKIYLYEIDE